MHVLDEACERLKQEHTAACSQAEHVARSQVTSELNQLFRRLRGYKTQPEWLSAVLDGASRLVHQVAVLELASGVLTLRGQYNLSVPESYSFPVTSAPAFSSAIESRDPVIALRTRGEVGEALSGPDVTERAHIFPILNGNRVVALIFAADQHNFDLNGLELVAGLASAVLERTSNASIHSQIALSRASLPQASPSPTPTTNGAQPVSLPGWTDLSEEQRNVHIKAQRFSRVAVAEMELAHPDACRAGREQANLYLFLKNDIDKAREKYRSQFMTIPSMVDYLHLELVRSAEGDELKLGADYPGQLD